MEILLLEDILIIFALASLVIFLFHRMKMPSIIGFLITGILAGPHGFGFIENVHEIEILAELGVVLLLFTIGIEFSLKNLVRSQRAVFLGGGLQVSLTVLFTYLLVRFLGRDFSEALFMGFLVALSSTAVVLKMIQEKSEISTPYGKASVSILIFQDLIIVPMILFVPILAGQSENVWGDVGWLVAKVVFIIGFTFFLAKWVMPRLLHQIARVRSRELFLLSIFVIGFAVASLTSALGLSLALGAFLAGLAISESEYSHHAFGNIIPFRDIFTSFFFVSIGMLLDLSYFWGNFLLVLGIAMGIILVKTTISGFVAFVLGFPFRTTVIIGLALSQVGEFSFILSKIGMDYELLGQDYYQLFIAVAVITMAFAPFIILLAPRVSHLLMKLPLPEKLVTGMRPVHNEPVYHIKNHLIIIGMGINGRNIAKAAQMAKIPYLILDSDPDLVVEERANGQPIVFGDATQENMLRFVKIENAEVVTVSLADSPTTYRVTELVRQLNPKAHLIIRTRYLSDVEDLYKAGANEVIPEEFETSVEIFSRVLSKYLIPKADIEKLIAEIRADGYEMFRGLNVEDTTLKDLKIQVPDIEISSLKVYPAASIVGKTIGELGLRKNFSVNILAIRRGEETIPNPMANDKILAGDIVYVLGKQYSVACITSLFQEENEPGCMES